MPGQRSAHAHTFPTLYISACTCVYCVFGGVFAQRGHTHCLDLHFAQALGGWEGGWVGGVDRYTSKVQQRCNRLVSPTDLLRIGIFSRLS
jgi:hypothetical protein